VPMGSVIKLHALYEEPFWRHEGLSGFAISDSGPVSVVYDDTPEAGSPGVLVGFMEGEHARSWARCSQADRRTGVWPVWPTSSASRPVGRGSCWSALGRRRSTAAAAMAATSRRGSGPPSVRRFASPSAVSTGPGPRPPPTGTLSWRGPCRAASGPPTRSSPPGRPTGGSGPRPGRPGAGGRRG
jgi:hypothetical protein